MATCLGIVARTNYYSTKMYFFDLHVPGVDHILSFLARSAPGTAWTEKRIHDTCSGMAAGDEVEVTWCHAAADDPRPLSDASVKTRPISAVVVVRKAAVGVAPSATPVGSRDAAAIGQSEAASVTRRRRAPKGGFCKYWLNSKRCPLDACTQPHPTGEAWTAARKEWHAARAVRRKEEARLRAVRIGEKTEDGPGEGGSGGAGGGVDGGGGGGGGGEGGDETTHGGPGGPGGRGGRGGRGGKGAKGGTQWSSTDGRDVNYGKMPKSARAALLCDWLVAQVGDKTLRRGSGVLDIAGGKGDVALALGKLNIPCTVVDPRRCVRRDGSPIPINQIAECFDDAFVEKHAVLMKVGREVEWKSRDEGEFQSSVCVCVRLCGVPKLGLCVWLSRECSRE